jgi:multicomponent Na+:H+ antiporter subunit D
MPSLPVAIPLLVAAVLAGCSPLLPRRLADLAGLATAFVALVLLLLLARQSADAPLVYWFGGWRPREGVAVGVAFVVDPLGAGLAALTSLLTLAALLFSWRYFDSAGALFHSLMLIFLAAMIGFCLSGDIFTLFVFFELMSAAAFALTGYKMETSALEGALNFALTNSVAAFLVLWGIALLYGRTGALNMAQIGEALAAQPPDALVRVALLLIVCGFFVKAAIVPFHFWLADAHAVAPTPVCVLFSGAMVAMGLFGAARVYWTIFSTALAGERDTLVAAWTAVGAATAVLGAVACFTQRHLKRLLAFSTVSHMGIALLGLGLLDAAGLAGAALYLVGHALVKGALFLCAGILLHRLKDIDVLTLHGRGRRMPRTATVFVVAGLGLAGCPPFGTFTGKAAIDEAASQAGQHWIAWVSLFASALTAAAVLRAAGRIFLGWGPPAKEEAESPTEEEGRETRGGGGHVPACMLLPAGTLVALALAAGLVPGARSRAGHFAARFQDRSTYAARVLSGSDSRPIASADNRASDPWAGLTFGLGSISAAIALAGITLFRERLAWGMGRLLDGLLTPVERGMEWLHTGRAPDYIAWLVAGVALLGLAMGVVR